MSKRIFAQYARKEYDMVLRKWYLCKPERVRVMVIAEGYAMVRHSGCMPFIVQEKELQIEAKP